MARAALPKTTLFPASALEPLRDHLGAAIDRGTPRAVTGRVIARE